MARTAITGFGQRDEAAEAMDACLDAFLDHLMNVIRLQGDFDGTARMIERGMAKQALRSAIELRQEPRY